MKAKFKCMKCKYEYEADPGPTICPLCNSLYVEWTNYWIDFNKKGKENEDM